MAVRAIRAMRVIQQGLGRDDGAILAMTAAAMVVILGMGALTVDVGNGWLTRQALIQATDAAALAAAQAYVDDEIGCNVVPDYLGYNGAAITLTSCDKIDDGVRGRVTVIASQTVETSFASAVGLGGYEVSSVSTAAWAPPSAISGLRPFALCLKGSGELQHLIENPPDTATEITIPYLKHQPDDCGDEAPGNWGTLDFDGGSISLYDILDWLEHGFDGLIEWDDAATSCDDTCHEGRAGMPWWSWWELYTLEDSGRYFTVPVYDHVDDTGGSNLEFHLAAILRVRLMDFNITSYAHNRFLTLRVKPGLVAGTCCASDGDGGAGNKVIAICGVEPDQFAACGP